MYKTGDCVRLLENGELDYLFRLDNQVKIRGFRIDLNEISSRMDQYPEILKSVVILNSISGDNGTNNCLFYFKKSYKF